MTYNPYADLRKNEDKLKNESSSTVTQSSQDPALESDAGDTKEPSSAPAQTKRDRGRPSKASKTHVTTVEKPHREGKSDTVTYLKRSTKEMLRKIKALMFLSTGVSLDEDAIVHDALICLAKTKNIKID